MAKLQPKGGPKIIKTAASYRPKKTPGARVLKTVSGSNTPATHKKINKPSKVVKSAPAKGLPRQKSKKKRSKSRVSMSKTAKFSRSGPDWRDKLFHLDGEEHRDLDNEKSHWHQLFQQTDDIDAAWAGWASRYGLKKCGCLKTSKGRCDDSEARTWRNRFDENYDEYFPYRYYPYNEAWKTPPHKE